MPGLKALIDRLPSGDSSRSVTLYTSSFSVGVGLSFLVSQLVADFYSWRAAFFVTGIAPFVMVATFKPKPAPGHPLDFRPVIRNRAALGYILGYGAHCFELYGMRTWIVSFWTYVTARNADNSLLGPVAISVLITLLSLPASVLGNEAALRFGRHRAIALIMFLSATIAIAIGFSATLSPTILLLLLLAYGFTVPGDSGALTSGMSSSAHPAQRGATMALHSTVKFGLSALGAWGTGVALDLAGEPTTASGWLAAFSLLAGGIVLGPFALWWSRANSPGHELKRWQKNDHQDDGRQSA